MIISARGHTDVGRKREINEDSFLVDEDLRLFVVADGMGGHAGGGTASRIAVQTIQERLKAAREGDPSLFAGATVLEESPLCEVMREAVEGACFSIYEAAKGDPSLAGMGTTVTALVFSGTNSYVAHVGDSRCYLVRAGHIYQVSEDHSLVNEQIKAGAITPDEARTSRFKNIITRSVGFEADVAVDMMGFEAEPGDRLILCCDGLSNLVDDSEILEVVNRTPPDAGARELVDLANGRGGDDNITVIVIHVS